MGVINDMASKMKGWNQPPEVIRVKVSTATTGAKLYIKDLWVE